ncbi:unnamed protein product [Amaranthus hypochondriacus]
MEQNQKHQEILALEQEIKQELKEKCLPTTPFMGSEHVHLVKYQNFWYGDQYIQSVLTLQRHFIAQDNDIILCSQPKTGTTWLKSLLFSLVNRSKYSIDQTPLLKNNPHELIHFLESIYRDVYSYPKAHNLNELPSPRMFSTHMSFSSLPESIKTCKTRVLYICRNPFDTFVSLYYFNSSFMKKQYGDDFNLPSIEDYFYDEFCQGMHPCGPFFDHILEFWKASLEQPDKVFFLKYEDLKEDPTSNLKRLAKFIGIPFSHEEESNGVIQEIIEFCGIKKMKELEVNKSQEVVENLYEKKTFFRKGEVGDWIHHFTPNMVEKMNSLIDEKLKGTGLSFKLLP